MGRKGRGHELEKIQFVKLERLRCGCSMFDVQRKGVLTTDMFTPNVHGPENRSLRFWDSWSIHAAGIFKTWETVEYGFGLGPPTQMSSCWVSFQPTF